MERFFSELTDAEKLSVIKQILEKPNAGLPVVHRTLFWFDLVPIDIIRNGRATIVYWSDGTRTVVKCAPDEESSDYSAFTAALAIKCFGSNSALKRMIKEKTHVQPEKPAKVKKLRLGIGNGEQKDETD